jgi:outer membrane protein assembly factor BamB
MHAALKTSDVRRLGRRWTRKLDGQVVAQPLFVADIVVRKRRSLVVYVTGGNSVYALDAANGSVVWRRHLGDVVETTCGGRAGIASTPAVDRTRRTLYVIGSRGRLHALDLLTGFELAGWPLPIVERTDVEYVWGALRVAGRRLYVPVASHCDKAGADGVHADGRLVTVDRFRRRVTHTLDVVAGPDNMGGLWGWGGVSVDRDGTVYAGTANSYVLQEGNLVEDAGLAERVLRLNPDLSVLGAALQTYKSEQNLGDQGFGSTPLLFRPPGCPALVAAHSKNGSLYVWRRGGRFPTAVFSVRAGPSDANDSLLSQPTWFATTRTLVVGQGMTQTGDRVRGPIGFRLRSGCRFERVWQSNIGGGPIAQPLAIGRLAVVNAPAIEQIAVIDSGTGAIVRLLATGISYAPPIAVGRTLFTAAADGTAQAFAPRS